MTADKPKAVFDCNIYLQAFLSEKGTAGRCKKLVDRELVELYISGEIFEEISEVLGRPEWLTKFPNVSPAAVAAFLEDVLSKAVLIRRIGKHFELPRDRKDEPYLNLAIEIKADFIVTWDSDLLDLMSDTSVEGKEFRQKSRPLKITNPVDFLRVVESERLSLKQ